MIPGLISALFAAVCFGVAVALQAVAARAVRDNKQRGVDPTLVLRLLRQWRFLCGLALQLVGAVAQTIALRSLPLFVVQATLSASIIVTALLVVRWFALRLTRSEWLAVGGVCVGLALLGSSARRQAVGHVGGVFQLALLVAVGLLLLAGLAAGRLPDRPRTILLGLTGGCALGLMAIALRVQPGWAPPGVFVHPATYSALLGSALGGWFSASAIQRGGVVVVSALDTIGRAVLPALVGVLLLGDHSEPGWAPVAFLGFVIATGGALVLARFTTVADSDRTDPHPVGIRE